MHLAQVRRGIKRGEAYHITYHIYGNPPIRVCHYGGRGRGVR